MLSRYECVKEGNAGEWYELPIWLRGIASGIIETK